MQGMMRHDQNNTRRRGSYSSFCIVASRVACVRERSPSERVELPSQPHPTRSIDTASCAFPPVLESFVRRKTAARGRLSISETMRSV